MLGPDITTMVIEQSITTGEFMSRPFIALFTLLSLAVPANSVNAATVPHKGKPPGLPTSGFPLGMPGTPKYHQRAAAPGVDVFTLSHGTSTDGYTVTVLTNGKTISTREKAEETAAAAEAAGMTPSIQELIRPMVADYPRATGYMVRIGRWPLKKRAAAQKVVKVLKRKGFRSVVDFVGDDGLETTGPWRLQVIRVNPHEFTGTYRSTLGISTGRRETTSSMARRAGAVAAVNGGFFSIHEPRSYAGDPTGISVVDGRLLSEAVKGRSALILQGRTARVTELESAISVDSYDGANTKIDGVNRIAKDNELILYTEDLGTRTPVDEGTEAVLDTNGNVIALHTAGHRVKPGTRIVHGTGSAAQWLWDHAWPNHSLRITTKVTDLRTGRAIQLTPETDIVGGGIGLVRDGRRHITAAADGMASSNMILHRHPRTLAGVTKSGMLLLTTVNGRKPGVSVGASLPEAAQLMRWLGARDAISLDGGGSSTMVVKNKVLNAPSDGVERPVGDAVLIVPRK